MSVKVVDGPVTGPAVYRLASADYHAHEALSRSGAWILSQESPLAFWWGRANPGQDDNAAQVFGNAAHAMVLGDPTVDVVKIDAPNRRTKAVKDQIAEVEAAGGVALLAKEFALVEAMARAARGHELAGPLLERDGLVEPSLFWNDKTTGRLLKCRPDFLPTPVEGKRQIIVDYKTARSIDPHGFTRAVAEYGYHMQAAWYLAGCRALGLADRDAVFVFIVQQKEPPFDLQVYELEARSRHGDPGWLSIGKDLMSVAVKDWDQCLKTGQWPGRAPVSITLETPIWVRNKFLEDFE